MVKWQTFIASPALRPVLISMLCMVLWCEYHNSNTCDLDQYTISLIHMILKVCSQGIYIYHDTSQCVFGIAHNIFIVSQPSLTTTNTVPGTTPPLTLKSLFGKVHIVALPVLPVLPVFVHYVLQQFQFCWHCIEVSQKHTILLIATPLKA